MTRLLPHNLLYRMPGREFPRHLQLAEHLCIKQLLDPEFNRLVVEWPIGHGKSEWFSYVYPLWYIITHPDHRVILAFGNESLRKRYANLLMDGIRSWGCITGVSLHKKFQSVEMFKLQSPHQGEIYTTLPSSGASQGMRGNLIICDDLVPTIQLAASQKERETITEWFWGVLMNRTVPEGTKTICVMSRRHPQDLSGSIQDHDKDMPPDKRFRSSRLEAICTDQEKDPLSRPVGASLWESKWSLAELQKIRQDYEDRGRGYLWHSQYQQDAQSNPLCSEFPPSYFTSDIWYSELPPDLRIKATCMSLDPSKGADAKSGDYSALLVGHLDYDGRIWVQESYLERATIPMVVDRSVAWLEKYKPNCMAVECNGFQEEIAVRIAEESVKRGIVNVPILKVISKGHSMKGPGKARIVVTLDPILSQKRVKFRDTPTNRRGVMQTANFPSSDHDDYPDALEMLVQAFVRSCG